MMARTGSGTDALLLALKAVGVKPGDEVITSAFSFVASGTTIVMAGATPVFVDIDPATFNLDPTRVERAITPRTRAVVPVHLYGQVAAMEAICDIARARGVAVVADDEIVLLDEWHAGIYGIPDEKTIEAIRLCARLEGVLTDPVYEGKSMAALIDLVRSGRIERGSRVLYAHLGGQPALNAYAGAF